MTSIAIIYMKLEHIKVKKIVNNKLKMEDFNLSIVLYLIGYLQYQAVPAEILHLSQHIQMSPSSHQPENIIKLYFVKQ